MIPEAVKAAIFTFENKKSISEIGKEQDLGTRKRILAAKEAADIGWHWRNEGRMAVGSETGSDAYGYQGSSLRKCTDFSDEVKTEGSLSSKGALKISNKKRGEKASEIFKGKLSECVGCDNSVNIFTNSCTLSISQFYYFPNIPT